MPIRNILYLLIQILNISPAHKHLGGVAVVVVGVEVGHADAHQDQQYVPKSFHLKKASAKLLLFSQIYKYFRTNLPKILPKIQ